ncbi:uncharacterized protein [Spinacia oleracea]|uniref:DUF569 domain-containing protein n=1 Tax=Spinacia oleracea TaxID=3562 RepID=A0A9R0IV27_SPIOL|nr:uncharacterized protein LOC110795359 [Spinacia oleracea]
MEFLHRAKVFRLKRSGQSKYLIAHKDEETIKQSRDKSSNNSRWTYELVEGKPKLIRLRSCCSWRYLATTEDPFLLGMTGKKIVQTISKGPIVEWEPIKEGSYIKLQSHAGSFLRANQGPPPWRNSVTHDEPGHWTATENMTLWIVDIVEIDYQSSRMGNGHSTSTEEVNVASSSCNVANQEVLCPAARPPIYHFANLKATNVNKSDIVSVQSTSGCVQPLQVKRFKHTFDQMKSLEFRTLLSLGQDKKLENVVTVLIADAKSIGQGKFTSKLVNIQEQLKSMKNYHESASQVLIEYSTFSTRRLKIRDELKKDAVKAREVEKVEVKVNNTIADVRAKREQLMKQLEDTENAIKDVKKAQADIVLEVDKLISRIEQKGEGLKDMESKERSWRARKIEAERLVDRVEKDWGKVKTTFSELTVNK